jgi:hypothetical protein
MADTNSSSTVIVAIVAIIVILALGFLLYRSFPMGNNTSQTPGANVNVNLPGGTSSAGY